MPVASQPTFRQSLPPVPTAEPEKPVELPQKVLRDKLDQDFFENKLANDPEAQKLLAYDAKVMSEFFSLSMFRQAEKLQDLSLAGIKQALTAFCQTALNPEDQVELLLLELLFTSKIHVGVIRAAGGNTPSSEARERYEQQSQRLLGIICELVESLGRHRKATVACQQKKLKKKRKGTDGQSKTRRRRTVEPKKTRASQRQHHREFA